MPRMKVPRRARRATNSPAIGHVLALRRGEAAVILAADGSVRDYEIAYSTPEACAAASVMQALWPTREQKEAMRRMVAVLRWAQL